MLYVYYHFVHQPTDATGVRDWWPDALPPLDQGLDVAAHENQPLWVLVHVPPDAAPGEYRGQVSLRAEGFAAQVPIQLHVWNFALPERSHLETAFGLSVGDIFRYHGVKTEADKRRVLDLYLQSFAEHRISPYDPTPLDPIQVKFLPQEDPPRAEVDFTAFDRAMADAVAKYHFNNFNVHVQGMGGGTFHERYPPRIGEFGEDTPQYQAMFSSYLGQLENHFREQRWLDMAYVYWFDEPEPRDYDFVAQGLRRLRQHAPGLRRMLTEEPGDNVLAGLVDIWCPISFNYRPRGRGKTPCGGRTVLVVRLHGAQGAVLHAVHRSPGDGTAGLALADVAAEDRRHARLADELLDLRGRVSRPAAESLRRSDGLRQRLFDPPRRQTLLGQRRRPVPLSAAGRRGAGQVRAPIRSSLRPFPVSVGRCCARASRILNICSCCGRRFSGSGRGCRRRKSARWKTCLNVPAAITAEMTAFTTDPAPIYTIAAPWRRRSSG